MKGGFSVYEGSANNTTYFIYSQSLHNMKKRANGKPARGEDSLLCGIRVGRPKPSLRRAKFSGRVNMGTGPRPPELGAPSCRGGRCRERAQGTWIDCRQVSPRQEAARFSLARQQNRRRPRRVMRRGILGKTVEPGKAPSGAARIRAKRLVPLEEALLMRRAKIGRTSPFHGSCRSAGRPAREPCRARRKRADDRGARASRLAAWPRNETCKRRTPSQERAGGACAACGRGRRDLPQQR